MGVPTMYVKLIEYYEKIVGKGRRRRRLAEKIKRICQNEIRSVEINHVSF